MTKVIPGKKDIIEQAFNNTAPDDRNHRCFDFGAILNKPFDSDASQIFSLSRI
jgi:hypothetical protein